jgi:hypothetical protein
MSEYLFPGAIVAHPEPDGTALIGVVDGVYSNGDAAVIFPCFVDDGPSDIPRALLHRIIWTFLGPVFATPERWRSVNVSRR